jgi:hypothetical protein
MNTLPVPEHSLASSPDPRTCPGFLPILFPLANGGPPPTTSADPRNDQIVMAFLAAYYEINVRWMELRAVRSCLETPERGQQERAALQAIESALCQRDELEDRWAPHGIIAEPIMEDGIARDILFTFGSVNAAGRFRAQPIVSAANLSFQVPEKSRRHGLKPPGPLPTGATTIFPCAD